MPPPQGIQIPGFLCAIVNEIEYPIQSLHHKESKFLDSFVAWKCAWKLQVINYAYKLHIV